MSHRVTVGVLKRVIALPILASVSFCHMLNDMMQALLPAVYPILKGGVHLRFGQIGLLTLTYQIAASLLYPMIGRYADRRAQSFSLPVGMGFALVGMVLPAVAPHYVVLLVGAGLLGIAARQYSTQRRRASRTWLLAASMDGRNLCSRSAAILASHWRVCWPLSSFCRLDRQVWYDSPLSRWEASGFSPGQVIGREAAETPLAAVIE